MPARKLLTRLQSWLLKAASHDETKEKSGQLQEPHHIGGGGKLPHVSLEESYLDVGYIS